MKVMNILSSLQKTNLGRPHRPDHLILCTLRLYESLNTPLLCSFGLLYKKLLRPSKSRNSTVEGGTTPVSDQDRCRYSQSRDHIIPRMCFVNISSILAFIKFCYSSLILPFVPCELRSRPYFTTIVSGMLRLEIQLVLQPHQPEKLLVDPIVDDTASLISASAITYPASRLTAPSFHTAEKRKSDV